MQQGSLIRSGRKRGPDVWQFRWADNGPFGKRIYRRRVIGTVCQYGDAESARKSVAGLLRELNANALQRSHLPITIAEVCDHFIQRELTKDNSWRNHSTKRSVATSIGNTSRMFGEYVSARKFSNMVKEMLVKVSLYNMFTSIK